MYPTKPLGEIIKITKGKKVNYSPEKGKYNYIDIGILRTGIIEQYTNDEGVFCDKEDILIAWDGSKSGTSSFGLQGVIGSTLAKLKLKDENISTEFVGKFLQSNFEYLNKNTSGAAIPHLRKDILENLQIPLPPLLIQQKIVEKLDKIFAKIDKNISLTKQNIANIDEENNAILEKIFTECEEEFGVEKFSESCEKITDGSHNPPKGVEKGFPMISSRNIENNKIFFDNIRYLSEEDYILENKRTNAMEGDILLSIVGTIGKVAIVKKEYGKFVMQRSLALLRFKNEKFLPEFVYYFLVDPNTQKRLSNGAKGATQKGIYLKDLKNFQIPLPPLPKQQEIVTYLDNIFAKNSELKNFYEKNLKNLEELRQSILKQAFEDENFIK